MIPKQSKSSKKSSVKKPTAKKQPPAKKPVPKDTTSERRGIVRVLASMLGEKTGVTAEQISEKMGIGKGAVMGYLGTSKRPGTAVGDGLVRASVGGPDAKEGERVYRYSLTAAGRKKAERAAAKAGSAKEAVKRPLGLLSAAILATRGKKEAMTSQAIFDAVIEKGLWDSQAGKTPVATLSAAIYRDSISEHPRWKKTGRGLWELTDLGQE